MPTYSYKITATTEQNFIRVFVKFLLPNRHIVKMKGSSTKKLTGTTQVTFQGKLKGSIRVSAGRNVEFKIVIKNTDNNTNVYETEGTVGSSGVSKRNIDVNPT